MKFVLINGVMRGVVARVIDDNEAEIVGPVIMYNMDSYHALKGLFKLKPEQLEIELEHVMRRLAELTRSDGHRDEPSVDDLFNEKIIPLDNAQFKITNMQHLASFIAQVKALRSEGLSPVISDRVKTTPLERSDDGGRGAGV